MKSVLLIEDNAEIRENTAELLELHGYKVFTAKNGNEGFKMVKSRKPKLILCDILMPVTDGQKFLQLIKKDEATSSIPFIFLSAGSVPIEVKKGLIQGADEYLPKPYSEKELLDVVERHLDGRKK